MHNIDTDLILGKHKEDLARKVLHSDRFSIIDLLAGESHLQEQCEKIANTDGMLKPRDMSTMFEQCFGEKINFYPSHTKGGCYKHAVFVSLQSKGYQENPMYLTFSEALETMVKHIHASCKDETLNYFLITDRWDTKTFEKWLPLLESSEDFSDSLSGDLVTISVILIKKPSPVLVSLIIDGKSII